MTLDEYYNYLLDTNIAEEQTLDVAVALDGYCEDTLDSVLYILTGYRDIEQYLEYEDIQMYEEYYNKEEQEEE